MCDTNESWRVGTQTRMFTPYHLMVAGGRDSLLAKYSFPIGSFTRKVAKINMCMEEYSV